VQTLRTTNPQAPTLCVGWDVRHLLAHLVQREHSPAASIGDLVVRREPGREKFLGRLADRARTSDGFAALTDRFLAGPPRWSPMSWAGESINLVEYVVHHEDIRRGGGPVEPRALAPEQSRALWARLGLFARLAFRTSPVGVALALPGGTTSAANKGEPRVTVTGEPVELALYVTGRRDAAQIEVTGSVADVARYESWLASR
jgi:uncharacterized protein (TIGR03085 family)